MWQEGDQVHIKITNFYNEEAVRYRKGLVVSSSSSGVAVQEVSTGETLWFTPEGKSTSLYGYWLVPFVEQNEEKEQRWLRRTQALASIRAVKNWNHVPIDQLEAIAGILLGSS